MVKLLPWILQASLIHKLGLVLFRGKRTGRTSSQGLGANEPKYCSRLLSSSSAVSFFRFTRDTRTFAPANFSTRPYSPILKPTVLFAPSVRGPVFCIPLRSKLVQGGTTESCQPDRISNSCPLTSRLREGEVLETT